jgi:predicted Zn-dependent peptidase
MNQTQFFEKDLPGGARLVGETVPGRRSAAIGIWLRVGSRDEEPGAEGLAHFIEHMVFKGTSNRTANEIAISLEQVGGSLEAFTTKDTTCFYARVLEEHTELALDVLGDLISHPEFTSADVELEKNVVIEELRTVDDTPEELIGDLAHQYFWPEDIMGSSILGTEESLGNLDLQKVQAFHSGKYRTSNVVVTAAGAVEPEKLERFSRKYLTLGSEAVPGRRQSPEAALSTLAVHEADLSQLHLVLMTPAPSENDPRRRAVQLLCEIFGGGMSSRLFQTIREQEGLAYSVQAYTEHFDDVGVFGTSMAVSPTRGKQALSRTLEEMNRLRREGLVPGELDRAKAQVRGSLVMGLESLTNRMSHLARVELRAGERETVEQSIVEFEAVSESQIREAAAEALDPDRYSLVALGPTTTAEMGFKTFSQVHQGRRN